MKTIVQISITTAFLISRCSSWSDMSEQTQEPSGLAKIRPLLHTPVQVTVGNDANFSPDLSKSGRYLAYTTSINGNQEVIVRDRKTGLSSRITNHAADDFAPVLNRDGSKVAFITRRQDAAGDVAVSNTKDFTGRIATEKGLVVGSLPDSEEVSPAWWESRSSLLVPVRSPNTKYPKIKLYNYDQNTWSDYGAVEGEFPQVSEELSSVLYVRDGKIFINDVSGRKEIELQGLAPGLWSRPRYGLSPDEVVAIRYHMDTNQDGQVDGADNGTVWMLKINMSNGRVVHQYQLTSSSLNAFMPEIRREGLFVTLQLKGSLEIFKIPKDGQGRKQWLQLEEDTWLNHIKSTSDKVFALEYVAGLLRGEGRPLDAAKYTLRTIEVMKEHATTGELTLLCSEVMLQYRNDPSLGNICAATVEYRLIRDEALRSSNLNKLARQRIRASLSHLESLLHQISDKQPANVTAPDAAAWIRLLRSELLFVLESFEMSHQELRQIQVANYKRFDDLSRLQEAQIVGRTVSGLERERSLEAFLKEKNRAVDLRRVAALRLVESLDQRNIGADELTQIRQRVENFQIIPAMLHELVAKRFVRQGKKNIAIQEYSEILEDHCKSDPSTVIDLSKSYAELALNAETEQNVDEALTKLQNCVEKHPVESIEARISRANALVQKGLSLMKVREYGMAIKLLRVATEVDPENLSAWRGLIESSYHRKVLPELRRKLELESEIHPNKANVVYPYGYSLTFQIDDSKSPAAKLDAIDASINVIEKSRSLDPSAIFPHQTLGWLHMQRGHWLKRYREDGGLLGQASAVWALTKSLFGTSDPDEVEKAIDSFQAALFLAKESSIERSNLIQNLGEAFHELQNHQKALVYLTERIKLSNVLPFSSIDTEASVYRLAGRSAFQIDELELAHALQKKSLEIWRKGGNERQIAYSMDALALTLRELNRFDEAIQVYSDLKSRHVTAKQYPELARTMSNIGYCQHGLKKYSEAIASFEESNKILVGSLIVQEAPKDGDAIAVDVGGQASSAKGFDSTGLKNLNLTFLARIHEANRSFALSEGFYREKITLLQAVADSKKGAAKQAVLEEILITKNNLGMMLVESGRLEDARNEFREVSALSAEYRSNSDETQLDEVINLNAWARLEMKMIILGVKAKIDHDDLSNRIEQTFKKLSSLALDPKNKGKVIPLLERISAVRVGLKNKANQELEEAGNDLHAIIESSVLSNVDSDKSNRRRSELALIAYELGHYPKQEQLASSMKEMRRRSFDPAIEESWRYFAAVKHDEHAMKSLADWVNVGGVLAGLFELQRTKDLATKQIAKGDSDIVKLNTLLKYFRLMTLSRLNAVIKANEMHLDEGFSREDLVRRLLPEQSLNQLTDLEKGKYAIVMVIDDGGRFNVGQMSNSGWSFSSGDDLQEAIKVRKSEARRVYLSCAGPRCHQVYEQSQKAFNGARVSLVSSPEQVQYVIERRKIAKSNVTVSSLDADQELIHYLGKSGGGDVTKVSGAQWSDISGAIGNSHMWIAAYPLYIGYERPWNAELKISPTKTWNLSQSARLAPWHATGVVFPKVQIEGGVNEIFDSISYMSVWAQFMGVPSVYIPVHPNTINSNIDDMNRKLTLLKAGVTLYGGSDFYAVGDPGLFEDEARSFAAEKIDNVKESALDARDDGQFQLARRQFLEAMHYAELIGDQAEILSINDVLVKSMFQARDFTGALHFQQKRIVLLKRSGVSALQLAGAQTEAGILATRAQLGGVARAFLGDARVYYERDEDHESVAKVAHYMGLSFEADADFDKTILEYQKAREIYLKEGLRAQAAQKLLDIGNVYKERMSNFPMALESYDKALIEFEGLGDKSKAVNVQIDRANTLMALGETKWAINLIERRVLNEIDAKVQPIPWTRGAQIVANAYYRAGMFENSGSYIGKIMESSIEISDPLTRAYVQIDAENLRGMNLEKIHQHANATIAFEKALSIARDFRLKGKEAMVLNNIGYWAREAGDVPGSLIYFETALKIDRDLKNEADQAYDLRNIAMSLTLLNNLAQAKPSAEEALMLSKKYKLAHNEAYSLFALAEISIKENKLDNAKTLFEQARTVAEKAYLQDFVWRAYAAVADIKIKASDYASATEDLVVAVKLIESLRAGLASASSRTGFASDKGVQQVYETLVLALMKQNRLNEAWSYSERSRARAFIDALGSRTQTFGDKDLDEIIEKEKRVRSEEEVLERKVATLPEASPDLPAIKSKLEDTRAQRQRIIDEVSKKWPKAMPFVAVSVIDLPTVQSKLESSVALLEYMILDDYLAYWTIEDGQISGGLIPVNRGRLRGLVDQYRELLQNFAAVRGTTKELSDIVLIEPIKSIKKARHITIVPHAELHYLPFASLQVGDDSFIEKYSLSFLESAEMLRFGPIESRLLGAKSQVTAFGNPNKGEDLDLPFAEREVNAIKRNFTNMTVFYGKEATKANFMENALSSEIIHFAGHGEFDAINPAQSRLLLAKNENLTVEDLFGLKTRAALVTLSACETGLGRLSAGDEIVGFNRAIFFSGAESIISSLWRVSDVASAITVKRFYRGLANGLSRAEALQQAQLITKKYYNHPAYWSAFKLSGDFD